MPFTAPFTAAVVMPIAPATPEASMPSAAKPVTVPAVVFMVMVAPSWAIAATPVPAITVPPVVIETLPLGAPTNSWSARMPKSPAADPPFTLPLVTIVIAPLSVALLAKIGFPTPVNAAMPLPLALDTAAVVMLMAPFWSTAMMPSGVRLTPPNGLPLDRVTLPVASPVTSPADELTVTMPLPVAPAAMPTPPVTAPPVFTVTSPLPSSDAAPMPKLVFPPVTLAPVVTVTLPPPFVAARMPDSAAVTVPPVVTEISPLLPTSSASMALPWTLVTAPVVMPIEPFTLCAKTPSPAPGAPVKVPLPVTRPADVLMAMLAPVCAKAAMPVPAITWPPVVIAMLPLLVAVGSFCWARMPYCVCVVLPAPPSTLPLVTMVIAPFAVAVDPPELNPVCASMPLLAVLDTAPVVMLIGPLTVSAKMPSPTPLCGVSCAVSVPDTVPAVVLMVTKLPAGLLASALMPVAPVVVLPVVMVVSAASVRMPKPVVALPDTGPCVAIVIVPSVDSASMPLSSALVTAPVVMPIAPFTLCAKMPSPAPRAPVKVPLPVTAPADELMVRLAPSCANAAMPVPAITVPPVVIETLPLGAPTNSWSARMPYCVAVAFPAPPLTAPPVTIVIAPLS